MLRLDHPVFDRLYYWYITKRKHIGRPYCNIISAAFASYYTDYIGTTYIIDSNTHSVVSEGKHTWDLQFGIVFPDYVYPQINPPKFAFIPRFAEFFDQELYEEFYSNNKISEAMSNVCIKKVEKIDWPLVKRKQNQL